jgi:hypothetical protein
MLKAMGPIEEVCRQQELLRKAIGPMEEARQTFAGYAARFHLPAVTETARLLQQVRMDPLKDMLAGFAQKESSLRRAMESMRTPWLDMQEQLRSVRGFAGLQSIGVALRSMSPFNEALAACVRDGVGDWRDTITWPRDIATNPTARSEFYAGLGFNHALTDFPAPAFEQGLDIAGLRREPPPLIRLYGAPIASSEDDIEEENLARTNTAHNWLLRLETQLRGFIDKAMTREFGANWPKKRLPNGLYDRWEEKKQKAVQAGPREWPLIAYADFTDYEQVICKGDNWRQVFQAFFIRIEGVRESLQRLYPIRLDTMHARPITQDDELLLFVETRRLVKAIRRRSN